MYGGNLQTNGYPAKISVTPATCHTYIHGSVMAQFFIFAPCDYCCTHDDGAAGITESVIFAVDLVNPGW